MRMLDLFSGIGGMSIAAEWAGIQTAAFCEIDLFCRKVLAKHWPTVPIFEDIRKLTKESLVEVIGDGTIDVIAGGFPCQPFSVAGKRRGTADDRHLWPEMFRVIDELRPPWVVGENVAGFVNMALDDVLSDLEGIGYQTRAFVIPTCGVGAPHKRERVFVVAYTDRPRGLQPQGSIGELWGRVGDGSEDVADSMLRRLQKPQHQSGQIWTEGDAFFGTRSASEGGGPVEPGLGRSLDGFSAFLDGLRWPSCVGQPQHEWEPPRVAIGVKNRVARLKALGNAVVPAQCYPIFQAISMIEEAKGGE